MDKEDLFQSPNLLAADYQHFKVSERLLLTGHSHQAWPDIGLLAQSKAWTDAAEHIDEKWQLAFEQARLVACGFAQLLGDDKPEYYTLAANTHDLLVRFISSLPLTKRHTIITTDGEFHSMRRQLDRLNEEAVEVIKVPVEPIVTLSERIAAEITSATAAVMMSAVMFRDAAIVQDLHLVAEAAEKQGAEFLVDAYHAVGVVPFNLNVQGLHQAFVVGGGYKYCQLGEGNCFLRVPPNCKLRPVVTGWYAEFSSLEDGGSGVSYGANANRFQGSTYDPTSHYRGASVFDFFRTRGLDASFLREVSQHQIRLLAQEFDARELDRKIVTRNETDLSQVAGFLALRTPFAGELQKRLRARNVWTDQRDGYLRLGPAPYLCDLQLQDGIEALAECCKGLTLNQ